MTFVLNLTRLMIATGTAGMVARRSALYRPHVSLCSLAAAALTASTILSLLFTPSPSAPSHVFFH